MMDLSKISNGSLQEAYEVALDEVKDAVHDAWSKRDKNGFAKAKIVITITVGGMVDGDTQSIDWAVKVACPARVAPTPQIESFPQLELPMATLPQPAIRVPRSVQAELAQ